jgi:flavodoxin I
VNTNGQEKGGTIMRVLVTYASQTGNTEKVAGAICEEAAKDHGAEMKKLEDVSTGDVADCDVLFLGAPIHAGGLAEPAKTFLEGIQPGSGQKIAGFVTHSAPTYPDQELDKFSEPIQAACKKNDVQYKGCFACQGFLSEALHEMIKTSQNLTDEQWAESLAQMTGHPDADDLEKARAFAREVLA